MTEQPLNLHEPEKPPRIVEVLNVFNNALIVLVLSLFLLVVGAALARIGG